VEENLVIIMIRTEAGKLAEFSMHAAEGINNEQVITSCKI